MKTEMIEFTECDAAIAKVIPLIEQAIKELRGAK